MTQWCHRGCPSDLSVHCHLDQVCFFPEACLLLSTIDLGSQAPSTSLFTACRHRKKRADLFQLSLFIREGRLSQRIPPLTTPHPPAQQTSLWVPWTALDYLTIHHLWEAGKASISYFYLIYWEVGSSKKGLGRKSCLIGLPHIGWRIEDLFWSVFLYCVKI